MKILIIRPLLAAKDLCIKLSFLGKKSWIMPLINFCNGKDLVNFKNNLLSLNKGDYIFTLSQNAVFFAEKIIKKYKLNWPKNVNYYSIGQSTAFKMHQVSKCKVQYPKKNSCSETLIKLLNFKKCIKNKKALILSGNITRNLLKRYLEFYNIHVINCECYYRYNNIYDGLQEGNKWRNIGINTLIVTSCDMLKKLYNLFPKFHRSEWLLHCNLIVISIRLLNLGKLLGWKKIYISNGANNDSLLKLLNNI